MTTSNSALAAYEAHNWDAVVAALASSDTESKLSADEQLMLADSLYWSGSYEDALAAFEVAFGGFVDEGRKADAGGVAGLLAYLAFRRRSMAVAFGWIAQAQEMLSDEPESKAHTWLSLLYVGKALFEDGDTASAISLADDAFEVAARTGSRSGQSIALSFKALAMIHQGDWQEAMTMLDESSVMAVSGDDLRMSADVYCNTISTCRNLGDYRRASEWTEEADRWMRANGVNGYVGACKVHRAELKRMHGEWSEAESEARNACIELERHQLIDYLGLAHFEVGEIRRRMGDLEGAQYAFDQAYEQGHDAQPGLALLLADRGEVDAAFRSIQSALDRVPKDSDQPLVRGPSRARLLPAYVDIALAADQRDAAVSGIDELEEVADGYQSHVWQAAALTARGALQVHDGEYENAVQTLNDAWRMWREAKLPYEVASTRAQIGKALSLAGDETSSAMEYRAALATFQKLGATNEIRRLESLDAIDPGSGTAPGPRVTRTFMFTDIVTSTDLIGLIGDESWQELLNWHDRSLRRAIESAGGEVVRHTGDGFFASFATTRAGIDCAVDIQRTLAKHRRETGFAPLVRVGLHRTEATRDGGDYSGGGIHLAARIGDQGGGEEIVLSQSTLDDAGPIPFGTSEPVAVDLKGISEPVALIRIDWS